MHCGKYRSNTAVGIDILYGVYHIHLEYEIINESIVPYYHVYLALGVGQELQKPRIYCEQIESRGDSMLLYVGQDAFEIPSFFFFADSKWVC